MGLFEGIKVPRKVAWRKRILLEEVTVVKGTGWVGFKVVVVLLRKWCKKSVKDSGHHISPQWYDIVHFGRKPSWICFWALPQKASYQWRYVSILIYP